MTPFNSNLDTKMEFGLEGVEFAEENTNQGPLKTAFQSNDSLGGFSRGEMGAWVIALMLWLGVSGGIFDDDSWLDIWKSSIVGLFVIFIVLYPSFILHNWANNKPLFAGDIFRNESLLEFLHISRKLEPDLIAWSKRKSLALLLISSILLFLGIEVFLIAEIMILFGSNVDFSYGLATIFSYLIFGAVFLFLINRSVNIESSTSLFKISKPPVMIAWLILIVMGIDMTIQSSLMAIIESLSIDSDEVSYWFDPESKNDSMIYSIAILNMVILGPIIEEIFFRGYLLDTLRGLYNERFAVILSSILFGLVHFYYGLIGIFLVSMGGALYAWLRLRTESLTPAIICHILWNGMIIIVFGIA